MKRLIVNADDFGLAPGIDAGITRLAALGIVTSVSVLAMHASAAALAALRAAAPRVGLGLHVDFTADLVRFDARDLEARLAEQLARFRALTGRDPDHVDSHKQTHRRCRAALAALASVGVPVRAPDARTRRALARRGVPHSDRFVGTASARPCWTRARLAALARNLGAGTTELMCHPAERFDGPAHLGYKAQREVELRAFLGVDLRAALSAHRVELVSWAALI